MRRPRRLRRYFAFLDLIDRLRSFLAAWVARRRPTFPPAPRPAKLRFVDFDRCEDRNPVSEALASVGAGVAHGVDWFGPPGGSLPAAVALPTTPSEATPAPLVALPSAGEPLFWPAGGVTSVLTSGGADPLAGDPAGYETLEVTLPLDAGGRPGFDPWQPANALLPPPTDGVEWSGGAAPTVASAEPPATADGEAAPQSFGPAPGAAGTSPPPSTAANLPPVSVTQVEAPAVVEGEQTEVLVATVQYPEGSVLVGSVDWGDGTKASPARIVPDGSVTPPAGRRRRRCTARTRSPPSGSTPAPLPSAGRRCRPPR